MDTASVISSLVSGTTYLRDPVEELLGHPAAKVISESCVTATAQNGCRMLTHHATGAKSRDAPYRWMSLRLVPWEEVLAADPDHRFAQEEHPRAAWHGIITELTKTHRRAPVVCASYFLSNLEVIFSIFHDKFELLDEDDPLIIQAAMQDTNFRTVLKLYFATGSPSNPKFFRTLASATFLDGNCLLHHCCERNFTKCVALLLEHYTPQSAPEDEPWLQLADPLWQDRKWMNSAFSIAAYRGYTDLLSLLWTWACEHNQESRVTRLRDKKAMDLSQIIEDRLKKCLNVFAYSSCFNVIAAAFGKTPMRVEPGHNQHDTLDEPMVLLNGEARRTVALPSAVLSIRDLEWILREAVLQTGEGVLILNVTFRGEDSTGESVELLRLLAGCPRVCLKKCWASPATATSLLVAATRVFSSGCQWRSLGIVPSWTSVPDEQGLEDFADAVEDFLGAMEDRLGTTDLCGFDMPPGSLGYFPPHRRHLAHLLSHACTIKRVAFNLCEEGPGQRDLRRKLRDDPVGQNPLLALFAVLERKLLNKGQLLSSSSVLEALDDTWENYAIAEVRWVVAHFQTFPMWAQQVGLALGSEDAFLVCRMMDQAVLYLLKMRASSRRPGLLLPTAVLAAIENVDLPLTQEYRARRAI